MFGTLQLKGEKLDSCGVFAANPITGLVAFPMPVLRMLEKVKPKMEAKLYVGNLSKSTTQDELNALFAQAGKVTLVEVIKDRKSGESKGFAFVTMSRQSEANKVISMFNLYLLGGHTLNIGLAISSENRDVMFPHMEQ